MELYDIHAGETARSLEKFQNGVGVYITEISLRTLFLVEKDAANRQQLA
jgi:hypothetical protein